MCILKVVNSGHAELLTDADAESFLVGAAMDARITEIPSTLIDRGRAWVATAAVGEVLELSAAVCFVRLGSKTCWFED